VDAAGGSRELALSNGVRNLLSLLALLSCNCCHIPAVLRSLLVVVNHPADCFIELAGATQMIRPPLPPTSPRRNAHCTATYTQV
jgi:hypothetical protein